MSRPASRPGTPSKSDRLGAPGSGAGTPARISRSSTPNRMVSNLADHYIKDPPNNLGLRDPSEQSRANDLIGVVGTVPVGGDAPTEEELKRIQDLADRLNSKNK